MGPFPYRPEHLLFGVALSFSLTASAFDRFEEEAVPAEGSVGAPSRALTTEEWATWLHGREVFEREWTASTGLGAPGFNAESCAGCHQDPVIGGAGDAESDVIRHAGTSGYGRHGTGNLLVNSRGIPRQGLFVTSKNSSVLSVRPPSVLPVSGLRPAVDEGPPPPFNQREQMRTEFETASGIDADLALTLFEVIQTPSLLGLGRIDGISDEEIQSREDPADRDRDGISGVASRMTVKGETEVGRFGWQAQTPHLADFVCMALAGETGITAPDQGRGFGMSSDSDGAADPEVSSDEFDRLVFYVCHIAEPQRGDRGGEPEVQRGERVFAEIGCAVCHAPTLQGSDGPVPLYSDLLLHQVLSRPIVTQGIGNHGEILVQIRTPPLWGVSRTAPFLHDGRAETLTAAIAQHGGEAERTRVKWEALTSEDQAALIAFLEDL